MGYECDEGMGFNYTVIDRDPKKIYEIYNRVYRTGIPEKTANLPIITGDEREIFGEGNSGRINVIIKIIERLTPIPSIIPGSFQIKTNSFLVETRKTFANKSLYIFDK